MVLGAFVGWLYDRKVAKGPHGPAAQRLGVLLASGFIVGESLFNVSLALLIVSTGKGEPLAVPFAPSEHVGMVLSLAAAAIVVVSLYRWARKAGAKAVEA